MKDFKAGFYGTAEMPPAIDEMIAVVDEKLGVRFPIEDLLLARPFGDGAARATSGQYLGMSNVLGVHCHHLAFQSENVDFQVWIEDGVFPVVRKAIVHRKGEDDHLRLTALFSNWDVQTPLGDFLFTYKPEPNALKVEFLAAEEVDETGETAAAAEKASDTAEKTP